MEAQSANRHGDDAFLHFPPNALVLDVGCDKGQQMAELKAQGCRVVGLDISTEALREANAQGLPVFSSKAEHIPLASGSVDGVVCRVVLPLTDESRVIAEIGRVLKRGGYAYLACHGLGYYLQKVATAPTVKQKLYGLRAIANTWVRHQTGRKLPGFLGDTMYQSPARLAGYYRRSGLHVRDDTHQGHFLRQPVFLYQVVEKVV